ncbi:MAG: hypothetical protein QM638_08880 [Nocardioides sp.]|uniref:hypothetical protein n=1 Tax=Nocardioides sp. TaxID=35761 RepID=UPI0039E3F36A
MSILTRLLGRVAAIVAATTTVVVGSVLVAGPAGASVPVGWPVSDKMTGLHLITLIVFIPVILAVVISALVLLPGVLRGEGLIPKSPKAGEDAQPPAQPH